MSIFVWRRVAFFISCSFSPLFLLFAMFVFTILLRWMLSSRCGSVQLLDSTELPERLSQTLKRIAERLIAEDGHPSVLKGVRVFFYQNVHLIRVFPSPSCYLTPLSPVVNPPNFSNSMINACSRRFHFAIFSPVHDHTRPVHLFTWMCAINHHTKVIFPITFLSKC